MISNTHNPTVRDRQRVKDLAMVGVTQEGISRIIGISDDTLRKHYRTELDSALDEMIEMVGKKAIELAVEGNDKMVSLVLKTRGAKLGWVEKQIIETTDTKDTQALHDKIAELERVNTKDY